MSESDELGIEILAAGSLAEHCEKLACLLSGRGATDSIKKVHKVRVLCRRICEVLNLSGVSVPVKKPRRRQRDVKLLADSLSPLRDADVHVLYVKRFIKNIPADKQSTVCPGAARILHRLKQERKALKRAADKGIKRFTRSKTMSGFVSFYADMERGESVSLEAAAASGLWGDCRERLGRRVEKVLDCEGCLLAPADIQSLHRLRIAFKKLRYTAEIYQNFFTHELGHILTVLEKFQTLLGGIHDCDVWAQYIKSFAKAEKELALEYCGNLDEFARLEHGFDFFRRHIRSERKNHFRQFADMWRQSAEKKVWEKFLTVIEYKERG